MKPNEASGVEALLESHLTLARIEVNEAQRTALLRHLQLVLAGSREQSLTAIRNPLEAVRLHVVDSLLALDWIPTDAANLVDIGSGQGYPAIPLGILRPSLTVTMIESNARKARFLEQIASEIESAARFRVLNCRVESISPGALEPQDVVTARAVASLASLVELSSPILRVGGILLAMKGSPETTELEAADRAAVYCGMSPARHHRYTLPPGGECRTISIYERASSPLVQLPRRVGLAQKRPLK